MTRMKLVFVCVLAAGALLMSSSVNFADSAAQIRAGNGLAYVKHVNDLPTGTTTLWVRSTEARGSTTLARVSFEARAEDASNVSRVIFASFRGGEEKRFAIDWGKAITDLNFIDIIAVRTKNACLTRGTPCDLANPGACCSQTCSAANGCL